MSDTREKKARKGTWSAGVLRAGGLQLYLLEWSEKAVLGKWHSRKDLGEAEGFVALCRKGLPGRGHGTRKSPEERGAISMLQELHVGKVVE